MSVRRRFFDEYGPKLAGFLVGIVLLIAVVAGTALVGTYVVSRHACERTGEAMGRASRYGLFEGCLVRNVDGRWVPLSAYREVNR